MSPGGDTFRRVQSGETFQMRAAAYNAMLDAADQARAVPAMPSQIASTTSASEPKLVAYNASDYNAPRGGIVELRARGDTVAQVEFVRPGDEGGLDVWGIAIDPIPAGRMGRIVLAGGRWRFLAADAAVGDRFGAADGSWIAVKDVAGPLVVARESIGGVAEGFFSRLPVNDLYYHEISAHKRMTLGSPPVWWLYWNEPSPEAFELYRFASPHSITSGLEVSVAFSTGSEGTVDIFAGFNTWAAIYVDVVREDFDLGSVTWEEYAALSRSQHTMLELGAGLYPGLSVHAFWWHQLIAAIQVLGETAYGLAIRARSDADHNCLIRLMSTGPRVRIAAAQGDNW